MLERQDLRILGVRIPPRDTTLFHRYGLPMAFALIGATATPSRTSGRDWDPPIPDDAYPTGPVLFQESHARALAIHR